VIERCDGELFEQVIKMFCEDAQIPKSVEVQFGFLYDYSIDPLVGLLDRFLKDLGNGRIITPTQFRVSFLSNWVGVFVNLRGRDELMKSIVDLAETLPLVNQRNIYKIWKKACGDVCGDAWHSYRPQTIAGWAIKLYEALGRDDHLFDTTAESN
jgi:hypothetical protein